MIKSKEKIKDEDKFEGLLKRYIYDPSTGFIYLRKNNKLFSPRVQKSGYYFLFYKKFRTTVHRFAFYSMLGSIPLIIDHKDQDKLNNKWENLRAADKRQNNTNQKVRKDNSSGFKGVYFHRCKQMWMARITVNWKTKFLGYKKSPEEAALLYNIAAIKYHGEWAWLNKLP